MHKPKDSYIKFRESIKRGNTIFELAPQVKIREFEYEVELILKILGHPEALVTDKSKVCDFREETNEVAELLGVEVHKQDYIWQIAERLATVN